MCKEVKVTLTYPDDRYEVIKETADAWNITPEELIVKTLKKIDFI